MTKWNELSGSTNWADMLDPLTDDLRDYIIKYGERAQAIMDAFNDEDTSDSRGFSRYPMEDFFSHVGLEFNHPNKYEVTQFLYAQEYVSLTNQEVNWIGYVAVATDEGKVNLRRRDILVVWRGTVRPVETHFDIEDSLVSADGIFGADHKNVMIHKGWQDVYLANSNDKYAGKQTRTQALNEVRKQVDKYAGAGEDISITVVGHGMGSALATLNAADIVANNYNYPTGGDPEKACLVTVFAFASPKVGDQNFKKFFDSLENLHVLRIDNAVDIVPNLPPVGYEHVGEQLLMDSRKSPYLKPVLVAQLNYFSIAHQLETILHVVAGWQGFSNKFALKDKRDKSLVNKHIDGLFTLLSSHVPASWWIVQNKGMVQDENTGLWALSDYKPPPPVTD